MTDRWDSTFFLPFFPSYFLSQLKTEHLVSIQYPAYRFSFLPFCFPTLICVRMCGLVACGDLSLFSRYRFDAHDACDMWRCSISSSDFSLGLETSPWSTPMGFVLISWQGWVSGLIELFTQHIQIVTINMLNNAPILLGRNVCGRETFFSVTTFSRLEGIEREEHYFIVFILGATNEIDQ
jgi:hypothetical protein